MKGYPEVLSPSEIRFQRLLPGPIETVWSYLTDARKRGEWLASGPMDLRVGGQWIHVMYGPDGKEYPNFSTFTEIVPFEKAVDAYSRVAAGQAKAKQVLSFE